MPELKWSHDLQHKLQVSPEQHLRHTIEIMQLLSMNADELYQWLSQMVEKNPILELKRRGFSEINADISEKYHSSVGKHIDYNDIDYLYTPSSEERSLRKFLSRQILFLDLEEKQRRIADYILDSLDHNGFFREDMDFAAGHCRVDKEYFHKCLKKMQTLDPPGICAVNLRESLLIQLERMPRNTEFSRYLISEHWDKIKNCADASALKPLFPKKQKEIQDAWEQIQSTNPRPANGFFQNELIQYVIPDLCVLPVLDGYQVIPIACFDLGYDSSFEQLKKEELDKEAQKYLAACIRQANTLFDQLGQREQLLQMIVSTAVDKQQDYLNGGNKVPLTQKQAAEELGVHPSTISRAIRNKFFVFKNRCLPVCSLFGRAVPSNKNMSAHQAAMAIREEILREDHQKPLSDQEIALRLERRGISISRRLVAKYRAKLQIPSASVRRCNKE